jgi:membrane glycosyltransferase
MIPRNDPALAGEQYAAHLAQSWKSLNRMFYERKRKKVHEKCGEDRD